MFWIVVGVSLLWINELMRCDTVSVLNRGIEMGKVLGGLFP